VRDQRIAPRRCARRRAASASGAWRPATALATRMAAWMAALTEAWVAGFCNTTTNQCVGCLSSRDAATQASHLRNHGDRVACGPQLAPVDSCATKSPPWPCVQGGCRHVRECGGDLTEDVEIPACDTPTSVGVCAVEPLQETRLRRCATDGRALRWQCLATALLRTRRSAPTNNAVCMRKTVSAPTFHQQVCAA